MTTELKVAINTQVISLAVGIVIHVILAAYWSGQITAKLNDIARRIDRVEIQAQANEVRSRSNQTRIERN